MTDHVIVTDSLTKTYGDITALDTLSLQVSEHAIFGFLGPNGAGKTTTMKLLLGLAKPTSGSGRIFGHDIVRDSVEIRARVGYLPQNPRFYEHMTARETLAFTARFFFTGPDDKIAERVNEMLALVGLADKADRPIEGFSGGERQRLGIAQAQVNYPDLLILDEPAAALDPLGRRDVLDVMDRLRKYTTIFYSTHILDDVQRVSDTVAILNQGKLVMAGPIESLLTGTPGEDGPGAGAYQLAFKGDAAAARSRLGAEDWITGIQVDPTTDGRTAWQVSVSDAAAAESRLLRLLLRDPDLVVTQFGRRSVELEDVFVQLVEGGEHGGK